MQRLERDCNLCVFCKTPATTVQHVTYRRAGKGDETQEDLRSLCRLCHDAVTMIEYGLGMGLDRINPEDPRWRELTSSPSAVTKIVRFCARWIHAAAAGLARGDRVAMYLSCLSIDVGDNPDRPRPGRNWLRNLYHVHHFPPPAWPFPRPRKADDPPIPKPYRPEDFPEQRHIADARAKAVATAALAACPRASRRKSRLSLSHRSVPWAGAS